MPTTKVNLADIVLILGSFENADGLLTWSENSRYEFTPPNKDDDPEGRWRGGQPAEALKPPFLCLRFDKLPYNPDGWVGGSASTTDECDLQIAESNQSGISRRHFSIDIDPDTRDPRVTVVSQKGAVYFSSGDRILSLKPRESREVVNAVTIHIETVSFRAWRPTLTTREDGRYRRSAGKFNEDAMDAVPSYIPSIKSSDETASSNIRYGRGGTVYINQGGIESKGTSASVMKVVEMISGKAYGAKEPYYNITDGPDKVRSRWEEIRREYENVIELDHVSVPLGSRPVAGCSY